MKTYCVHCGQPIPGEAASPGKTLNCPACGKATTVPVSTEGQELSGGTAGRPAPKPSRFKRRDLAIGAVALLLLIGLACLFLRPDHSAARRVVFGGLASAPPTRTANAADPSSSGSGPGSGSYSSTQPAQSASAGGSGVSAAAGGGGSASSAARGQPGGIGPAGSLQGVPDGQSGAASAAGDSAAGGGSSGGGSQGMSPSSDLSENPSLQKQAGAGAGISPATDAGAGSGGGSGGGGPGLGSGPGSGAAGSSGPQGSGGSGSGSGTKSGGAAAGSGAGGGAGNKTPRSPQAGSPAAAGAGTSPADMASSAGQPAHPAASPASAASGAPPAARPRSSTAAGQSPSPSAPSASTSQPNSDSASASSDNPSEAMPAQVAKESTADLLEVAKTPGPESQPKPAEAGAAQTGPQAGQPVTDDGNQPGPAPADANVSKNKDAEPNPENPRPFEPQRGSNVVFVLDHSLSMGGEKSARARRELVNTLEHLGTNKSFYVIFFPYKAMPAPGPLSATPEHIQSMTNWIYSLGHSYGSDPTKAMERALEFKPDTVWLLSDGKFSSKVPLAIRAANLSGNARVHTVGFYERAGEQVLRQIADENGGTYRFVPPPDPNRPAGEASPAAAPK